MTKNLSFIVLTITIGCFLFTSVALAADQNLVNQLKGKILLQVEENGEAWYVDIDTGWRFYLKDGDVAYGAMRAFGLGITNKNLEQIPVGIEERFEDIDTDGDGLADRLEEALKTDVNNADTDSDGFSDGDEVIGGYNPLGAGNMNFDYNLAESLKGRILLQVESRGEAWYINPEDGKRYYMKDGAAAYQIMRFLSLGINNENLEKIDSKLLAVWESSFKNLDLGVIPCNNQIVFDNLEEALEYNKTKPVCFLELNEKDLTQIPQDVFDLTNLGVLRIHENQIDQIPTEIINLKDLSFLSLEGNNISDLSPIAAMDNLKILVIADNNISDLSPIEELVNLVELNFSGNNVSDLSSLSELTELRSLHMRRNNISDISYLSNLSKLNKLEFEGNSISDITALSNLTKIKRLIMGKNNISDITPLSGLVSLETLALGNNEISGLGGLENLSKLSFLEAKDNNISDITSLEKVTGLTSLYLDNNQISNITAISSLTDMVSLFLNNNNISDISSLESLDNYQMIELKDNGLTQQQCDNLYESLSEQRHFVCS